MVFIYTFAHFQVTLSGLYIHVCTFSGYLEWSLYTGLTVHAIVVVFVVVVFVVCISLEFPRQQTILLFDFIIYFRLVEEFMLLANMAVAHKIKNHYPETSFLRRHPPPQAKMVENLVCTMWMI